MKKVALLLFFYSISVVFLFSQNSKRTNIWYFGENAGIDFNTNPPSPLLDGALKIWEGCATICDTMGQLMIYTDGIKIWNKNHEVIPGATNLGGNNSATQSGIIVPKPGSHDSIYVFSVDDEGGSGGLRYAIVDMTLNGGLGGLISANNRLLNPSTEKITVIQHCNKIDYWIIAHEFNSSKFYTWKLSTNGMSSNAIITDIGAYHGPNRWDAIGYLKASPKGDKFAIATGYSDSEIEIYDFDNETGLISNPVVIDIDELVRPYGVEFSPSGDLLYFAGAQNQPNVYIFQIDLTQPTITEILASILIVGEGTSRASTSTFGALQNAPDGKIYIAKENSNYLSVISNPNKTGVACGFLEDNFYLGGAKSQFGLPNLVPNLFIQEPTIELSGDINFCNKTAEIQSTIDIVSDSIVYQWYFENTVIPNQLSPQIQVDTSGEYRLEVMIFSECQVTPTTYSQTINITLPAFLEIQDIQTTHPLCGLNDGSINIIPTGGEAPYTFSFDGGITFQSNNLNSDLESGIYEVVIQDNNGCKVNRFIELVPTNSPTIDGTQIINTSCGEENGAVTVSASNGTGLLEFSNDGQNFGQGNTFNNLNSGSYNLTVIDLLGCFDEIMIEIEPSEAPTIGLDENIPATCNKDNGTLNLSGSTGVQPFEFSIDSNNFQNSGLFEDLSPGNYIVSIRDSDGCIETSNFEIKSEEPISIETYDVTNSTCGKENGSIQINTDGGTSIEYSIDNLNFQSSNAFENLPGGNYQMVVRDENNCTDSISVVIESGEAPVIQFIETTDAACGEANGSILIEAISDGIIEYSTNGSNFQSSNIFLDLNKGTYTIFIIDENNCVTESEVELQGTPPILMSNIETSPAICGKSNGKLSFKTEGNTGETEITVNGNDFSENSSFENLPSGEYQVTVKDEIGCKIDTLLIIKQDDCPIFIPSAFSPNNDGINDYFKVYTHPDFKTTIKTFKVFDRWGTLLFTSTSELSSSDISWDGTFRGKTLPPDVYVYFLEMISESGEIEIIEGDISIIK